MTVLLEERRNRSSTLLGPFKLWVFVQEVRYSSWVPTALSNPVTIPFLEYCEAGAIGIGRCQQGYIARKMLVYA
jgi:hypothetical protein